MLVMKFGGTSVEDATALHKVVEIVVAQRHRVPLVVLSACAGVTNALIDAGRKAAAGKSDEALAVFASLQLRHNRIADELLGAQSNRAKESFETDFDFLRRLVFGLSIVNELTPRALDQIVAHGERWSSSLLALALEARGIPVTLVDARTVMITGNEFTKATPLFDIIDEKAQQIVLPLLNEGNVVVTQGFIGSTRDGSTTTIGRGGSDYSAAIFGAALHAEEIQIWTDVDGILTADPSIIADARRIKEMTFNEAAELAYFGARVLHPATILPAVQKNIPVRVLNSRRPDGEGTLITQHAVLRPDCVVKSVAYKEGITVIGIQSTRMLMAHGFLARVFDVFERYKKSIDVVVTSEVGISLTVDDSSRLDEIVRDLSEFADVSVEKEKAVCCVVGERMKSTKGIAARVFRALAEAQVNIELISQGGSEINLTFVVDEANIAPAVRALHREFFPAEESGDLFEEVAPHGAAR